MTVMSVFISRYNLVLKKWSKTPLRQWSNFKGTAQLRLLWLVCVSFPFSFQFFTRLAAVFTEEVGDIDDQHDLAFVRLKRGVSRERALLG
jgi:hypothetical protein